MLALIWPHTTTATTAYGKRVVDSFLSTLERAGDAQEGVVFDVGSNDGGWTKWLLRCAAKRGLAERIKVHMFEPQPRYAEALRALASQEPGNRIQFHPFAASSAGRTNLSFHLSYDRQTASTVSAMARAYSPGRHGYRVINVRSLDLAEFMHAAVSGRAHQHGKIYSPLHQSTQVALFKCDIEGGEYELLPWLITTGVLCPVHHILVEWHLNALPPQKRLAALGLRLAFDALLRNGCGADEAYGTAPLQRLLIEHDEYPRNNRGEPVHGLPELCDAQQKLEESRKTKERRQPGKHSRWSVHDEKE